jgi:RNA polymerase sigma-70 factor (ECF subfamily)
MTEHTAEYDNELIERFRKGDEAAYEELVQSYAPKAYQIAYGLLGNRLDAEEVVQDAFMKVHANLERFRGDSSFATWLYRIITNLSRNKYHWNRRRGKDINVSLSDRGPADESGLADFEVADNTLKPDVLLDRNETESVLMDAISRLPDKLREVLVLRHLEEMSYADMADLLGCELGTVKSRLARAREALKQEYERSR